jgi:osmotically-inducible protein OsmY
MDRDDQLRQLVIDELEWEPRLHPAHIGVACRNGVVTLSGHVDSYAAKKAAEHVVRRVRGVKALALDLEVRLPSDKKTADDEIAARAAKFLEWDAAVPSEDIGVVVEHGIVRLTGTVEWQYQKAEAEQDVRKLTGVRGVVNEIVVRPKVRPEDVKDRIRKALERHADLDAAQIQVNVEGDKVILDGKVAAWTEREVAEQAAWCAPGVRTVEDHIAIGHP